MDFTQEKNKTIGHLKMGIVASMIEMKKLSEKPIGNTIMGGQIMICQAGSIMANIVAYGNQLRIVKSQPIPKFQKGISCIAGESKHEEMIIKSGQKFQIDSGITI